MVEGKTEAPATEALLELGVDTSIRMFMGRSALHQAAYLGQRRKIELLAAAGADINVVCSDFFAGCSGVTPLHCADDFNKDDVSGTEELLRLGADVHKGDDIGQTPLHYAASYGLTKKIEVLVKGGADMHKKCAKGEKTSFKQHMTTMTK